MRRPRCPQNEAAKIFLCAGLRTPRPAVISLRPRLSTHTTELTMKSTTTLLLTAAGLAGLLPACAELGPTGNAALVGGLASGLVAAGGDSAGAAAIAQGTLNAINDYNSANSYNSGYSTPSYQAGGDTGGYDTGAYDPEPIYEEPAADYLPDDDYTDDDLDEEEDEESYEE